MKYKITKMKRIITITLLLLSALVPLSGCSLAPYATADISKNPSLVHFDINNPPFDVKKEYVQDKGKTRITLIPKYELGANKTFSMKYHHRSLLHSAPNVSIIVEFPNGRKYAALLDTGFNESIFLTSDIVLDNKLAILPNGPYLQSNVSGICHIPVLKIGPAQIKDAGGVYWEQQWQYRILNIPIYKHSAIILGVKFIKTFSYVLFDNVSQEVIFSKDETFEPNNPQLWNSFPFSIKLDSQLDERIMVQIPIDRQIIEVWFDSGGDKPGLSLNEHDWQTIEPNLTVKQLRNSHGNNFQSGRFSCQMAKVSELSIGEKIIKNADVLIYDDPKSLSMISLGYFQDTIVVLDFVNNLMWIKK